MENGDEWISVVDKKKQKKLKWKLLKQEYPHIIAPSRALRIQNKINIDNLYEKLMSDEWIDYQKEGWWYVKVLKPSDPSGIPENTDTEIYSILTVDNGYDDKVLFVKYIR